MLSSPAMVTVGTGVALTCGLLYFFFRLLGKREMKRRNKSGAGARDGDLDNL